MRLPIVRVSGKNRRGRIDIEAVTGLPEALESAAEFHDSHFVATQDQTVFTVAHTGQPLVYVNGVLLGRNLFDATDLEKITLTEACSAGDVVRVIRMAGSISSGSDYFAGAGLDLTGSTFTVKYGAAAGTAAQGNDSRIENGETAYGWGDHSEEGYLKSSDVPTITVSTGNPTGGKNGDIWFKV